MTSPQAEAVSLTEASQVLDEVQTKPRRLKPYAKYKDSGIEWLGEIPEHWNVRRLKYLCKKWAQYGANESAESYQSEGVRFIRTTDIEDNGNLTSEGVYLDEVMVKDYILNDGDILLSRSGTIGRSFLYISEHGLCSYAGYLVRFVPNNSLFPKYAFYYTKSSYFDACLNSSVISTTIGNVNGQKYANFPLPFPSLSEQKAISVFLDRETAKIDSLVAKKRQLIELLRKKRTALISKAVTKGLNPNVKMKPSGIDWLGDIPEHWGIKRLRFVSKINPVKSEISRLFSDTEISFVPMESVHEYGGLDLDQTKTIEEVSQGYTYFRDGDVVIAKITPCFENGKGSIAGGLTNSIGFGTTELHVIRPLKELDKKFLFYLTISPVFRQPGESEMYGAGGQKRVPDSYIRNYFMPLPPILEQEEIAKHIEDEWQKTDCLLKDIEAVVGKLLEYRSSLISAAVTGKIDVSREASE